MVYGIKNKKIVLLAMILMVSTLLATKIQFVKGNLFQNAMDLNGSLMIHSLFIMGVMILGEVSFYLIEWTYENVIIRKALAEKKKKVIESALDITQFDHADEKVDQKMNLLTNTIDDLEYAYYMAVFDSMYLIFRIVFVTISLAYINLFVGALMLLLMFVPLLISNLFKDQLAALEEVFNGRKGENLSFYKNFFDNLKNIRILHARSLFLKKAHACIEKEREAGQISKQRQLYLNCFYSLYSYMVHFLVLAASVYLLYRGRIESGMIITLLGLTEQLSMPILSLSRNMNSINSTKSLRKNIESGILLENLLKESLNFQEEIKVEKVATEIGDKELVYRGLSFQKGKKYLIEGPSGTGKSVLLELLTGLRGIKEGEVLYDEKSLGHHQVFDHIAYVPTNLDLFQGNGVFNIVMSEEYTQDQWDYMTRFIGENKLKAEDMSKLSAGEKRRILNLRGLLSDKPVLIFDEPTSNLDERNASIFFDEMRKLDKTVIIVSHDVPMKEKDIFDQVIRLENHCESKEILNVC